MGPHTRKENKKKLLNEKIKKWKNNISKNISVKRGCRSAQKKESKFGWGGSKLQKLKFGSILLTDDSPVDKENSIWEKKSPKLDVGGLN